MAASCRGAECRGDLGQAEPLSAARSASRRSAPRRRVPGRCRWRRRAGSRGRSPDRTARRARRRRSAGRGGGCRPASVTAAATASGPPRRASARSAAAATPSSARSASDSVTRRRSAVGQRRRRAAIARSRRAAPPPARAAVALSLLAGQRLQQHDARVRGSLQRDEADQRRAADLVDVPLDRRGSSDRRSPAPHRWPSASSSARRTKGQGSCLARRDQRGAGARVAAACPAPAPRSRARAGRRRSAPRAGQGARVGAAGSAGQLARRQVAQHGIVAPVAQRRPAPPDRPPGPARRAPSRRARAPRTRRSGGQRRRAAAAQRSARRSGCALDRRPGSDAQQVGLARAASGPPAGDRRQHRVGAQRAARGRARRPPRCAAAAAPCPTAASSAAAASIVVQRAQQARRARAVVDGRRSAARQQLRQRRRPARRSRASSAAVTSRSSLSLAPPTADVSASSDDRALGRRLQRGQRLDQALARRCPCVGQHGLRRAAAPRASPRPPTSGRRDAQSGALRQIGRPAGRCPRGASTSVNIATARRSPWSRSSWAAPRHCPATTSVTITVTHDGGDRLREAAPSTRRASGRRRRPGPPGSRRRSAARAPGRTRPGIAGRGSWPGTPAALAASPGTMRRPRTA